MRYGAGLAIAAGLLALLAAPTHGQAPSPPRLILEPAWDSEPTAHEVNGAFPALAARQGTGGQAVIGCTIAIGGALNDCIVDFELPEGVGFGAAGLSIVSRYHAKSQTRTGIPQGGARVAIPIMFELDGASNLESNPSYVYRDVAWLQTPTIGQVLAAYPARARSQDQDGTALVSCLFGDQGELTRCKVEQETPAYMGFGAAAISLFPYFRGPTVGGSGGSTRDHFVVFTIVFPRGASNASSSAAQPVEWAGPSPAQIASRFPEAARQQGVAGGQVTLNCRRDDRGGLLDCSTMTESPAGADFGAAAISLAPFYKFSTWARGAPTSQSVQVQVLFGRMTAPNTAPDVMRRGIIRAINANDFTTAQQLLDIMADTYPNDETVAPFYRIVGAELNRQKRYEELVWTYSKLARLSGGMSTAYNALCWLKATRNIDAPTAVADCNEAIRMIPDSSEYFDSRGLAYLRLADFPRAIADYDQALRLDNKNASSLMGRGIAKIRSGDARGGQIDIHAAQALSSAVKTRFEGFGFKIDSSRNP